MICKIEFVKGVCDVFRRFKILYFGGRVFCVYLVIFYKSTLGNCLTPLTLLPSEQDFLQLFKLCDGSIILKFYCFVTKNYFIEIQAYNI